MIQGFLWWPRNGSAMKGGKLSEKKMGKIIKRVFFGAEVIAPWPLQFPPGRVLPAQNRHMTLAFLGNVDIGSLEKSLQDMPIFPFHAGITGFFDSCLPLPTRDPTVVSWHAQWYDKMHILALYQHNLACWLESKGYALDKREWLPHVTICRKPFDLPAWEKTFYPLPFYLGSLHLYESLGNLTYTPLKSYPLVQPFIELDHTADIAFRVNATDLRQLYLHAFCALAFKFTPLLAYFKPLETVSSLDEIVRALNELITLADSEVGCGLKAVCYHGEVNAFNNVIQWEMIVDV